MRKFLLYVHSATFVRKFNGWMTIFWIVMIPISVLTGWVASVIYVSAISLWALVAAHWSTYEATRVLEHQEQDANVREVLDLLREMTDGSGSSGTGHR